MTDSVAKKLVPVILSGGSGTRLWPLSRELHPKQFHSLVGEETLLQSTVTRLDGLEGLTAPIVICNEEHRFFVAEQLRQIGCAGHRIILEPEGRNTAPAVALAAIQAMADHGDCILVVMPADHAIRDIAALREAMQLAVDCASQGGMVTFGVTPTSPHTGYGYIRATGRPWREHEGTLAIEQFVEKPDRDKAEAFLREGNYYWNSGMFAFAAQKYLDELAEHRPEILQHCQAAMQSTTTDLDFIRVDAQAFCRCESDSIDYAVMEHTRAGVVIPLGSDWNDVGSWTALSEEFDKDERGNARVGDVIHEACNNCFFYSRDRLIAAAGVDDLIVVETTDAVFVTRKGDDVNIRNIVATLKQQQREEAITHRKVMRPWGNYDALDIAERFKVKRITVEPGQKLSLQLHHHRAEHWIVVSGTAKVTRGNETFMLSENESTFIPVGERHRLENPGKIPLELIEVQSGGYLGEDDIVRFEDNYGR